MNAKFTGFSKVCQASQWLQIFESFIWGTWYWVLLYFFFGIVRFFGSALLWKKDQTNQKHTLIHNCSFVCFIRNERQVQTCFFAIFSRDVEDGIVRIINHKINISNPILIRITHDGHCFIKSTSTFKNKSVLLEWFHAEPLTSMHGNFPMNNRFLNGGNVLHTFKNGSLKGSLGNSKWYFYTITTKTPFWSLYF